MIDMKTGHLHTYFVYNVTNEVQEHHTLPVRTSPLKIKRNIEIIFHAIR